MISGTRTAEAGGRRAFVVPSGQAGFDWFDQVVQQTTMRLNAG